MNNSNKTKSKDKKRLDYQSQIIQKKNEEIESLKGEVSKLEYELKQKDELIKSIEPLRKELKTEIESVKAKRVEYDKLMLELMEMRKLLSDAVFGGKWWLVKKLVGRK